MSNVILLSSKRPQTRAQFHIEKRKFLYSNTNHINNGIEIEKILITARDRLANLKSLKG